MVKFLIEMESSSAIPSPNWGSLMHGMLIEHLTGHWPSALHSESARPVAQWVEPRSGAHLIWHLQILDDNLATCFLNLCSEGDQWYCQHNGSRLTIRKIEVQFLSIFDYLDRCLAQEAERELTLHFKTAATHKSQNRYVLFPTPELIGHNLRNKLLSLEPSLELPDEHLKLLTDQTRIIQYHLQTVPFQLEGSKINGYTGYIHLRLSGPDPMVRFGNMLFGLAPWFGVGIKTALGMGGCLVSQG